MNSSPCLTSQHPALAVLRQSGLTAARVESVLRCYDEPHRCYHDRRHLREMLDEVQREQIELTPAQALALLFHDAVYVPGAARGSNEQMSAQLLRVYADDVDASCVQSAIDIILDTAEHEAHSAAAALVLDLDLLRLAAPPAAYETYTREVFSEQRPLIALADDAAAWRFFVARRRVFVDRLLARRHVFHLDRFRRRYERAARANLARTFGHPAEAALQATG